MHTHYFTIPFFTLSAAPVTQVAGRWPRVAHGRKIAKAFFYKIIKIKPKI
jgi:hypothetical protein